MALPTPDKTYNFTKINQQVLAQGSNLATNRRYLRTVINNLIALGFVCVASSDGAGGFDAMTSPSTAQASRWTDDSKLVWNGPGSNHSWIVLENTLVAAVGTPGNPQIKFDLDRGDGDGWQSHVKVSSTGAYTGGTATDAPVDAATEFEASPYWNSYYGTFSLGHPGNQDSQSHVWCSTDGEVLYIAGTAIGSLFGVLTIAKVKEPETTNWPAPWVAIRQARESTNGTNSGGFNTSYTFTQTHLGDPGNQGALWLTSETIVKPADAARYLIGEQNLVDEDTNAWPLGQVGLFSSITTHRGRKGLLFDTYWGLSSAAAGDTYVNGLGQKEWIHLGQFVVKWTNTAMEMT